MNKDSSKSSINTLFITGIILTVGGGIGTWSLMALISSLSSTQWSTWKLYKQYVTATDHSIPEALTVGLNHGTSITVYLVPILIIFLFPFIYKYFRRPSGPEQKVNRCQ